MEAGDDHRKGFMTISMKVCAGPGMNPVSLTLQSDALPTALPAYW